MKLKGNVKLHNKQIKEILKLFCFSYTKKILEQYQSYVCLNTL